jgi:hypothetical protein
MDTSPAWKRLIGHLRAVAKRLVTKLRGPKPTPSGPWPSVEKPISIPADPAEHAVQFAEEWYDRLEFHSRRRLRELGISESRIGAYDIDYDFRHAAFHPKERTGGSNSPGARINLDSGVLNPELLAAKLGPEIATLWARGRLRDRMDAIIAHEDIEGLRVAAGEELKAAHAAADALAPDTPRPIREGARRILRAIREHEPGRERG